VTCNSRDNWLFNVSDWLGKRVLYNGIKCHISRELQSNGDLVVMLENGDKTTLRPYLFLKKSKMEPYNRNRRYWVDRLISDC